MRRDILAVRREPASENPRQVPFQVMSRFTEALVVTPLADGKTWVLVRAFGYEVGEEGSGDRVDVAVGFQTDFASIPRLLWFVLPKWGRYGNASVIHDWLYWTRCRPRVEADAIFHEAMGVLRVRALTRLVIWAAVRAFGWLAWIRNRADRDAGFDRVLPDLEIKASTRSGRKGIARRLAEHALRQVRRRG